LCELFQLARAHSWAAADNCRDPRAGEDGVGLTAPAPGAERRVRVERRPPRLQGSRSQGRINVTASHSVHNSHLSSETRHMLPETGRDCTYRQAITRCSTIWSLPTNRGLLRHMVPGQGDERGWASEPCGEIAFQWRVHRWMPKRFVTGHTCRWLHVVMIERCYRPFSHMALVRLEFYAANQGFPRPASIAAASLVWGVGVGARSAYAALHHVP
jgi:hypothetical protein